jgi:hypothetical protein
MTLRPGDQIHLLVRRNERKTPGRALQMRSSTRILDFGREKHIMTRPAQVRPAGAKTRLNATRVRNVSRAEAKSVRCAGLSLLVCPLSDRRCFSGEKKSKSCDPAGDWMLWPHTDALGKNCFHRSSRILLTGEDVEF